ncbi:MAG: hypothetical protein ACRDB9_01245 [Cetobacterium sp.]
MKKYYFEYSMLFLIFLFPFVLIFLYNYLYSYFPDGKFEEKLAWITFLGGYTGSFFTISGIWFQIKMLQKQNDREKFEAFFLELLFYIKKTLELSKEKERGFLFQTEICYFEFTDPEIEKEDKYFYGDLTLFFLENKNKIFALPFNNKISEIIYEIKEVNRLTLKLNEIKPKLKIIDSLGNSLDLETDTKLVPIFIILRILKKISIVIDKYNNSLPINFLYIDEDLRMLSDLKENDRYINEGSILFFRDTLNKIEEKDEVSRLVSIALNKDFINFMEILFSMLDDSQYLTKYQELPEKKMLEELISIKKDIYKYYKIADSINGIAFEIYDGIEILDTVTKEYLSIYK